MRDNNNEVELIEGGIFNDERGSIRFVNSFNFEKVKRFYQVEQKNITQVRAWQGHKVEHKYFFVAKGSFLIATVAIDDWVNPSNILTATTNIIKDTNPAILSVPPGYANGIKALEPNSILIIYSNLTVEESENDRYSFHPDLWLNWQLY